MFWPCSPCLLSIPSLPQGRLEVFEEYYRNARLEQLRLVVGDTDVVSHFKS